MYKLYVSYNALVETFTMQYFFKILFPLHKLFIFPFPYIFYILNLFLVYFILLFFNVLLKLLRNQKGISRE